jgi:hypothetical protein
MTEIHSTSLQNVPSPPHWTNGQKTDLGGKHINGLNLGTIRTKKNLPRTAQAIPIPHGNE